ncbi:excisionase family DNA binding protein [Cytobacillus eiseniae]|uniref:Excisionase family DNA binding protein n=2 Tax=Cytobacillus TaxID=2675230 RepID=A0ABS4RFQ3_9BACI|nr:helix-turn-helix domain-containing protein [Cytobacillus eiseniae]MBP2241730.1 excisionase family DNA binding protein [Cytobacillus eiseniae]
MEELVKEDRFGLTPKLPKTLEEIEDGCILTPEDLANYMGLSVRQVRRYCEQGKIRSLCFGRKYVVYGSDFKEFLRKSLIRPSSIRELAN